MFFVLPNSVKTSADDLLYTGFRETTLRKTTQNELVKQDKAIQKKQAWNARRRELHKWVKRADAVGIKPLPSRRPTKGQRKAWEESIVRAEQD